MKDQCIKYLHGVTKATAVHDAASNCFPLVAYRQNKYYMLALLQDWLVVFLQNIVTFMMCIIFKCKQMLRSLVILDIVAWW